MADTELLQYFTDHYFPKAEVLYRLPLSVRIDDFWPELLEYRKKGAITLPLRSWDGHPYWYRNTDALLSNGDRITGIVRDTILPELLTDVDEGGVIDEAYYSSVIEGAYSTRQRAHEFIASGIAPKDRSEQMILNNYTALKFVIEHSDAPINDAVILEIARILTEGTLEGDARHGYRDAGVQVISGRQEIVYTAPDPQYIRPMMDDLLAFINDPAVHPIVKACAAHVYFVTAHPLFDGNGRTARALAYMILLKAGYDFIRQLPISGILAKERTQYYRAIRASQDTENGYDITYFMEYYTAMLVKSVDRIREHVERSRKLEQVRKAVGDEPRLITGAEWLVREEIDTITAEKWKNKFRVSFETARQDLMKLESCGFLARKVIGRKIYYVIPKKA